MVIWRVPRTPQQPGVRYRLALVLAAETKPTILYDNHHPKGHHRHVAGTEAPYRFGNVELLIADFLADVERVTGAGRIHSAQPVEAVARVGGVPLGRGSRVILCGRRRGLPPPLLCDRNLDPMSALMGRCPPGSGIAALSGLMEISKPQRGGQIIAWGSPASRSAAAPGAARGWHQLHCQRAIVTTPPLVTQAPAAGRIDRPLGPGVTCNLQEISRPRGAHG